MQLVKYMCLAIHVDGVYKDNMNLSDCIYDYADFEIDMHRMKEARRKAKIGKENIESDIDVIYSVNS